MKVTSFIFILFTFGCAHKAEDPIKGPLDRRSEAFRQCYYESDSYLGKDANPPGSMMVSFTVTEEGKVADEKIVKSSFKDPSLHACILDQIRRVRFGKLKTQTEVYQPINFIPVVR